MTNDDLHGAALAYDDPDTAWSDQVNDELRRRYPRVSFCSHDELNLMVRGNNWEDVTGRVDYESVACSGERWMVVDRERRPIVTGMLSRDTAQAEADDWNENRPGSFGPYRVVRDIVAETS